MRAAGTGILRREQAAKCERTEDELERERGERLPIRFDRQRVERRKSPGMQREPRFDDIALAGGE
jgi:hypothetical protein